MSDPALGIRHADINKTVLDLKEYQSSRAEG